jgi:hypothetical protein
MKTFFRKLFNLRTDLELVGLLYVNYEGGFICHRLEGREYKHVLTAREHKRLEKLVKTHLEGSVTATVWCYVKGLVDLEEFANRASVEKSHRKLFLDSLYSSCTVAQELK